MKVTNKLRKAIQEAILAGMCEMIDRHCPEIKNNPPDTWDEDTRRRFDLITDVEAAMSKAVNKVLDSTSVKRSKKSQLSR